MCGHVVVENSAAPYFDHEEDIERLKSGGDRNQEVASDNALGMISERAYHA
jgi:hypothetical protein